MSDQRYWGDCPHPDCRKTFEVPLQCVNQTIACPHCGGSVLCAADALRVERSNPGLPVCVHCQSEMSLTKRRESNLTLQILGVVVFLIGLGLCFTLVGAIVGIPLMIVAARMGFKKFAVMACGRCGYYYKV